MSLIIRSDLHRFTRTSRPLELVVDLDDDGFVGLGLDVELSESLSTSPIRARLNRLRDLDRDPATTPAAFSEAVRLELDALELELEENGGRTIDRSLYPHEARALAAALWHHADESERPR